LTKPLPIPIAAGSAEDKSRDSVDFPELLPAIRDHLRSRRHMRFPIAKRYREWYSLRSPSRLFTALQGATLAVQAGDR